MVPSGFCYVIQDSPLVNLVVAIVNTYLRTTFSKTLLQGIKRTTVELIMVRRRNQPLLSSIRGEKSQPTSPLVSLPAELQGIIISYVNTRLSNAVPSQRRLSC